MQSILWSVILQMGESQRLTHWVQGVALSVAITHFSIMLLAWWCDWLEIRTIYILMIIEWVVAVGVISQKLKFPVEVVETDSAKSIFAEFWQYCLPLVPYAWLGFAYEFADRWLLQTYGGSIQQAYYSVAFQFGSIAAIATSSILNIFWKEIAEANQEDNQIRVAMLYRKVTRGLFFLCAAGAGFLAPWAGDILRVTLGAAYVGGATTLMIMFFYPLHQSMGQIGGTMAFATGRVSVYSKLGMIFMASSIVVTYFILASNDAPLAGLDLGSQGLAGKMLVMQILSVNALAYYLARSLKIEFDWLFQPIAAVGCLAAGLLAYAISNSILDLSSYFWLTMIASGVIYSMLLLVLIWLKPDLAGLHRTDVAIILGSGMRALKRL